MRRIALAALLLLALSSSAVQAQESRAAHLGASWLTNCWEALVGLVEVIVVADQKPASPPSTTTLDNDCGAGMDPTGGCRR
jgi:hypothetical protein